MATEQEIKDYWKEGHERQQKQFRNAKFGLYYQWQEECQFCHSKLDTGILGLKYCPNKACMPTIHMKPCLEQEDD